MGIIDMRGRVHAITEASGHYFSLDVLFLSVCFLFCFVFCFLITISSITCDV